MKPFIFVLEILLAIGLGVGIWLNLNDLEVKSVLPSGTLKWVVRLPSYKGSMLSHVSLAPDEDLVITSDPCPMALSSEGKLFWTTTPPLCLIPTISGPMVVLGPNGSLYGHRLAENFIIVIFSLRNNGELRWTRPLVSSPLESGERFLTAEVVLALSRDGKRLYVSVMREKHLSDLVEPVVWWELYALNTDNGAVEWMHSFEELNFVPSLVPPSIVVLEDDSLITAFSFQKDSQTYSRFLRISPQGEVHQLLEIPSPDDARLNPLHPPILDGDGNIYASYSLKDGDRIYSFSLDGSVRQIFSTDELIVAEPVIGPDGTLYVLTRPCNLDIHRGEKEAVSTLWAIDPQEGVQWTFVVPQPLWVEGTSGLVVGADHVIYLPTLSNPMLSRDAYDRGALYALNVRGEVLWSFTTVGGILSSPALAEDGTLYLPTTGPCDPYLEECETRIYAVQTSSLGLADSPWPTRRGNSQRSGQVNVPEP